MAWFDNFPYSVLQKLNLDWIIKKVKEIDETTTEKLDEFQTVIDNADVTNAVKYSEQSGYTLAAKNQARTNIGAVGYETLSVLTDDQQAQARSNIGAQVAGDYALASDVPDSTVLYTAQSLTSTQQSQARSNIDAISSGEVNAKLIGTVVYNASQSLTSAQQEQARNNIGAQAAGEYPTTSEVTSAISASVSAAQLENADTYVAYNAAQDLTDEEKEQARANIGAQEAGNYVSFDAQALSAEQQAQVRTNIGITESGAETGDAVLYTTQALSDEQKETARTNIGAQVAGDYQPAGNYQEAGDYVTSSDLSTTLEDYVGVADLGEEIVTAVNNVAVKYSAAQDLTEAQQAQARSNIGAVSSDEVSASVTGVVKYDEAQSLTSTQQAQARSNIGAVSSDEISTTTAVLYTPQDLTADQSRTVYRNILPYLDTWAITLGSTRQFLGRITAISGGGGVTTNGSVYIMIPNSPFCTSTAISSFSLSAYTVNIWSIPQAKEESVTLSSTLTSYAVTTAGIAVTGIFQNGTNQLTSVGPCIVRFSAGATLDLVLNNKA